MGPRSGSFILFCECDTITGSGTCGLFVVRTDQRRSKHTCTLSPADCINISFTCTCLYDYQSSVVIVPPSPTLAWGSSSAFETWGARHFIEYREEMDVQQIAPNLTRSSPNLS